jgi:hypothetical protein
MVMEKIKGRSSSLISYQAGSIFEKIGGENLEMIGLVLFQLGVLHQSILEQDHGSWSKGPVL